MIASPPKGLPAASLSKGEQRQCSYCPRYKNTGPLWMSDKIGATCRNRAQITRAPRLRSDLDLTWSDHKASDRSKSFISDKRYFIKLSLSNEPLQNN